MTSLLQLDSPTDDDPIPMETHTEFSSFGIWLDISAWRSDGKTEAAVQSPVNRIDESQWR